MTTLMQPSSLSRNVRYIAGASSRPIRCVMMKDGSISPRSMRSSSERHVLVHVGLAHLERQALGERGAERKLVEPAAVDAGDRDRAALAAGADRLPQRVRPVGGQIQRRLRPVVPRVERRAVRLEADRVDAGVGALPAGHVAQRVEHVDLLVVQRLGARPATAASASRSGKRSMAMTRSAPSRYALLIANWPTGPQPQTATVSPGLISQFSAAM